MKTFLVLAISSLVLDKIKTAYYPEGLRVCSSSSCKRNQLEVECEFDDGNSTRYKGYLRIEAKHKCCPSGYKYFTNGPKISCLRECDDTFCQKKENEAPCIINIFPKGPIPDFFGFVNFNKKDTCCPYRYRYIENGLNTTCAPKYGLDAPTCYNNFNKYICQDKMGKYKCLKPFEKCNGECYPGKYWCKERGRNGFYDGKCIPNEEHCDCSEYKFKCKGEHTCWSTHIFGTVSEYRVCPDGTCIENAKAGQIWPNTYPEDVLCKKGEWQCGFLCKTNQDEIRQFRSCGNKCIPVSGKCLKSMLPHPVISATKEIISIPETTSTTLIVRTNQTTSETKPKSTFLIDRNTIIMITIGASAGAIALILIIVIPIIIIRRKKKNKEVMFVDDNPMYGYTGEDEEYGETAIVDDNEYYGANSDNE